MESSSNFDMNQMEQMMQMAQAFAELNQNLAPEEEPVLSAQQISPKNPPPLRCDEMIHTPRMKAIKAAIPYMEPSMGKMLAIMIKFSELRNLIQDYEAKIPLKTTGDQRLQQIAHAMRPYCDNEMNAMVAQIEKISEMQKMIQLMGMMKEFQDLSPDQKEEDK